MKRNVLLLAILAGMFSVNVSQADDNVHFSGALVSEPCTLPDGDQDIQLDFSSVIMKSLYSSQRTASLPFTIHLENCDPSLMATVNVTFQGTADDELTNLFALEASSTAKGVAIGLEQGNGQALAINKASAYQQLSSGNNSLTFKAYVQAKPVALAQQKISPGNFTAISTFVLGYQ